MNYLRRMLGMSLLGFVPLSSLLGLREASAASIEAQREAIFSAVMDCFIPADSAPGIVELGLHNEVLEHISRNQKYLRSLDTMLESVDKLSLERNGSNFERATLESRTDILSSIFDNKRAYSQQHRLLSSLRTKAITAYYSDDAGFDMLAYHPPSAGGYPDYDRTPD